MSHRWPIGLGVVVGLFLVAAGSALADVKLPAILADHMVLQQGADIHLWGWADPGERIAVAFADQKAETAADENGRWAVHLQPMKAGGPFDLVVQGRNTVTLADVLVGEVWVCSGQSNMESPVGYAANAAAEIAAATYPSLRLFTVEKRAADEPLDSTSGQWVECRPKTVAGFSAVAYFFGRDLVKARGAPVGLIVSTWGGTSIEAWMSRVTFQSAPGRPASLYNGMIAPILPYRIRGVLWYQGESNVDRPDEYLDLFSALISGWRADWGQGDFPFLFVQLANYLPGGVEPPDSHWASLREVQRRTLAIPRTAMAVAIDLGEADNIHPKNKQDVGRRLALAARAVAYGEPIEYSGPIVQSAVLEGGRVRLSFDHVGSGLVARGDKLIGFAVAGDDGTFVWADARIDGDSVLVWSDAVPKPRAVRYAWADNPDASLYNREGLPASPFHVEVRAPALFDPTLAVWLHAAWMLLAVAVGTVAGYLGLVRATQREALRVPGRFNLRLHKWTGIAFYAMLYLGILGGFSMVQFFFGGADPVGFWLWHKRLAILIGLIYVPAAWLGLDLLRRPAGPARARPIAHLVLNFTACTLIAAQIALALLKIRGVF